MTWSRDTKPLVSTDKEVMNSKRKYALAVLDMLSVNMNNRTYFKGEELRAEIEVEIESIRRILRATIEKTENSS
jgi:hypothetical protein